jgi:hypothetical protein
VYTREALRIELLLECGQRLAEQKLVTPDVQLHIVVRSLDPVDSRQIEEEDPAPAPH